MRRGTQIRASLIALAASIGLLAHVQALAPSFLWKATGRGGTIYLAGSVHQLSEAYYPLAPAFDQAFKDSDLLVEEVDLDELLAPDVQFSILMGSRLEDGQTLDKVLKPETMALLKAFSSDLGPAAEALYRFKPWMLATVIEGLTWEKAGFDPDLGLDKHFFDLAKGSGKAVKGLETSQYQVSLFDSMTLDQQDRFLAETLKELKTEQANITKLADAWQAGDAPTIERLVLSDLKSEPELYERLLVNRNRAWLPQLEGLFSRPGHALVIVGAAHLVGPDGLLQMLKAKGYTIEQM